MGKGRKNRKPQSTSTPAPAPAVSPTASPISASAPARVPITRKIALQFAAILALGTALGFIFNAANPIGVRFADSSPGAELRTRPATNFNLLSTSSIAAKTTTPVSQPAGTPSPFAQPSPAPLP